MGAKFGPAGTSDSFAAQGYKKTAQMPEYLGRMGLDAFEYQCGRGVNIGLDTAAQLGGVFAAGGIALSLHAPYYISLSSLEEEKRMKSVDYILQSARAAAAMGAERVVVHSGSCGALPRERALSLASGTMKAALEALKDEGLYHRVRLCPETMGKVNQLGTLDEVLALCGLDESLLPCIDFGHLNSRDFGIIRGEDDYRAILDQIENQLGSDRLKTFHSHFSKIEYTKNGGEKRHLTFEDREFGPDYQPLCRLLAEKGLSPVVICESAGTQAEDAALMKAEYLAGLAEKTGCISSREVLK